MPDRQEPLASEMPEQPDGIHPDSLGLPTLAKAASRVRVYIAAMGDGLYEVVDGQPLYGRDLEVLVKHAEGTDV